MTKARRTEGPCAPLFYSVLLGLSGTAVAQTVDMAALETCSRLETEAAKLECFESIVSEREAVVSPEAVPDAVVESAPSAPPAAEVSAAPIAVVPAAAPAALAVERKPADSAAPAAAAAAPAAVETEQPASGAMSADEFGREHLDTRSGEAPEVLRARVVEVSKGNHDALVFHLDNGQIWRQIQPRYYPYPRNETFDATITTGMLGEYQLQVNGEGRKVSVRRLK